MKEPLLKIEIEQLQEEIKNFDAKSTDSVKNLKEHLDSLNDVFSYLSDDVLSDADRKIKKIISNVKTNSSAGVQSLGVALENWQKQVAEVSAVVTKTAEATANMAKEVLKVKYPKGSFANTKIGSKFQKLYPTGSHIKSYLDETGGGHLHLPQDKKDDELLKAIKSGKVRVVSATQFAYMAEHGYTGMEEELKALKSRPTSGAEQQRIKALSEQLERSRNKAPVGNVEHWISELQGKGYIDLEDTYDKIIGSLQKMAKDYETKIRSSIKTTADEKTAYDLAKEVTKGIPAGKGYSDQASYNRYKKAVEAAKILYRQQKETGFVTKDVKSEIDSMSPIWLPSGELVLVAGAADKRIANSKGIKIGDIKTTSANKSFYNANQTAINAYLARAEVGANVPVESTIFHLPMDRYGRPNLKGAGTYTTGRVGTQGEIQDYIIDLLMNSYNTGVPSKRRTPVQFATQLGVEEFTNNDGDAIKYYTYNGKSLKKLVEEASSAKEILDAFYGLNFTDTRKDIVDMRKGAFLSKLMYLDQNLDLDKNPNAFNILNEARGALGIKAMVPSGVSAGYDNPFRALEMELEKKRLRGATDQEIKKFIQEYDEEHLADPEEYDRIVNKRLYESHAEVSFEGDPYWRYQKYSNDIIKFYDNLWNESVENVEEGLQSLEAGNQITTQTVGSDEYLYGGRIYKKDIFELEKERQKDLDESRMEELQGKPKEFKDIPLEDRALTENEKLSMFANRLGRIIDFSQRLDKALDPVFSQLKQTDENFKDINFNEFVEQFIANLPDENLSRTLFERYKRSQSYWEAVKDNKDFAAKDFLGFFKEDKYGVVNDISDEEASIYTELKRMASHNEEAKLEAINTLLSSRFETTRKDKSVSFTMLLQQLARGDTFGMMHAKNTDGDKWLKVDYDEQDGFSTGKLPREYGKGAAESYYQMSKYQDVFEAARVLDNIDDESQIIKKNIDLFTDKLTNRLIELQSLSDRRLPDDGGSSKIQTNGDVVIQSPEPIEVSASEVKAENVDNVATDVGNIQTAQPLKPSTKKRRSGKKKKSGDNITSPTPPVPTPQDDNKIYDVHLRGKNILGPEVEEAQRVLQAAGYVIRSIRSNDIGEFIGFDLGKKSKRGKGTVDARTTNKKLLEVLEQHLFPQVDRIDKNVDNIAKNGVNLSGSTNNIQQQAFSDVSNSDLPWSDSTSGGTNDPDDNRETKQESRKREYLELLRKQYAYQLEINKLEQESYIAGQKGDTVAVENRQKRIDGLVEEQKLLKQQGDELYDTLSAKHKKSVKEEERIQQIRLKTQSNLAGYTGAGAFGAQTGVATVTVEDQAQAEKEYEKALNDVLRIQKQIYATKHQADVSTGKEKQVNEALIPILQEQLNISAQQVKNLEKSNLLRPKQMKAIQAQFELDVATAEAQEKTRKGGAGNLFDVIANDVRRATMRITDFGLAAKALNSIPQSIQRVKQLTGQLEEALMNLRVVAELNREEGEALILTYAKMGKELGESTTGIAASANEWLRQGYNIQEANKLIASSTKLAKLGMISQNEATKALNYY